MHNLRKVNTRRRLLLPLVGLLLAAPAAAQSPADPQGTTGASTVLPEVTVTAPRLLETLPTDAASERRISGETLNTRPIERPGEVLEAAPGLIVTQHSGEGKANQYFLRGFNLDHGTDLAIWLDGMPINMRTHGHGQGYADVNFLIPELLQSMLVRKGPYWAEESDFASAGALRLAYATKLDKTIVQGTGGSYGYWRGLAAGSFEVGSGTLTAAGEIVRFNGPWVIPDNTRKYNGFLRYSEGTPDNGLAITALAYTNSWHSTDQIPQRAVGDGRLWRFGAVDGTDGGDAQRYSLSASWWQEGERSRSLVEAYFIYQTLNLYSNFTYYLDNPNLGDQFQQTDKRKVLGLNAKHGFKHRVGSFSGETTVGLQFRYDDIGLGLFNTVQRVGAGTVRYDQVNEGSLGLWIENKIHWNDWLHTTIGLRGDFYAASVSSNLGVNSGATSAFLASPKAGLILGPWDRTEFFVNAGVGYHSNDVRGTTIVVDPSDPTTPARRVPLMVRSRGGELGVRSQTVRGLDTALALFVLDLDSEILFVGDAGTTEASRPSRRIGVEWVNTYRPNGWATFDLDLAYTHTRFTDWSPAGSSIPGSPIVIGSAGMTLGAPTGWFGALRWRYFGARPLTEDGSVWSSPTSLINGRIGYVFEDGLRLQLDVFNLLNTQASQIDYFYTSRLPGEPAAGFADRHFHPVEPLSLRFTLSKAF
jgi:hypothetical protein